MTTILLTAIGGDIAQGVATIIQEYRPHDRLVGVDKEDLGKCALHMESFRRVPAATDPQYLQELNSIISSESTEVVIPLSEAELDTLEPHLKQWNHVHWVTPGSSVIRASIDKLETFRVLSEMSIPVPWTVPADEEPLEFPCVFKPRRGSGSRSFFVIRNGEDVRYLADRYPEAIFQELLEPSNKEITCAVYRTKDKRVAVLQMLRRLKGGLTAWAQVVNDDSIERMCREVAERLDLRGSMNIQLRVTEKGPRIFEINPRFSSTAVMRHRTGFTDVLWSLDELENKMIQFPRIAPGSILVRTHNAVIIQ